MIFKKKEIIREIIDSAPDYKMGDVVIFPEETGMYQLRIKRKSIWICNRIDLEPIFYPAILHKTVDEAEQYFKDWLESRITKPKFIGNYIL